MAGLGIRAAVRICEGESNVKYQLKEANYIGCYTGSTPLFKEEEVALNCTEEFQAKA